MRVYRKRYGVSEEFPVEVGDNWTVTEGKFVAENWYVIEKRRSSFIAEITEYFHKGDPPRRK